MKYLKTHEEYVPTDYDKNVSELKKLLSHFIKLFSNLGFDYNNYFEHGKYEIEFSNDKEIGFFYISMNIDHFESNITLELKKAKLQKNNIVPYIPEYFENINGMKFIEYDDKFTYTYKIEIEDVDKIIEQITIEDFEFKLKVNDYNL